MPRKQQKTSTEKAKIKSLSGYIWVLYALIVLLVVAYALTSNGIVAGFAFVIIVMTLIAEFRSSVKDEGAQKSIYEIITALAAVVVLWIMLSVVLNTSSPINVVASCSMLPNMHRGDLIILHGISNMSSFLSSHSVPVVNVPAQRFASMESNISNEFLAYYVYQPGNKSNIAEITNLTNLPSALYNTKCIGVYQYTRNPREFYTCAANQSKDLITYSYSLSRLSLNSNVSNIASISSIAIANQTIVENYSNPIIVYKTIPNDTFYPEVIIHRIYAAINASGKYYILTKGDNNPGIDMEFGNYPISQSNVVGYVIADIPVLGYIKLILSGQFAQPAGCNYVILR